MQPPTILLLPLLFFQVLLRSSALVMYEGKYFLIEVLDAKDEPIQLPVGRFDMEVASVDAETEPGQYRFSLKIGNILGGSFKVEESDNKLKMGAMRSTMMMPPEDLYALENTLYYKLFPAVTTLELHDSKLTFKGSEGSIVFKSEV